MNITMQSIVNAIRFAVIAFLTIFTIGFFIPSAGKSIASAADNFLGTAEPSIGGFGVEALPGGSVSVSYKILGNLREVRKVATTANYRKYPESDWGSPAEIEEQPFTIDSNAGGLIKDHQDSDGIVEGVITDFGLYAGIHRFTLEVFGKDGQLTDDSDVELRIYDDEYVDLFRPGGIEGCKFAKGTGSARHECDPYSQKREALETDRVATGRDSKYERIMQIYNEAPSGEIDKERCRYASEGFTVHVGFTNGCSPEEIEYVYDLYTGGNDGSLVRLVRLELESTLVAMGYTKII